MDPRLGKVSIVLSEDETTRCGWCSKPLGKYGSQRPLAPVNEDNTFFSVWMPAYHHACGRLHTIWAQYYGLSQALRFRGIKKNKKTENRLRDLRDRFYEEYEKWQSWQGKNYG